AQLADRAEAEVESLSGGMKRRLTIARALVNDPELLLLDEPTTGLDPQARHVLWDKLFQLKSQGVTLLLTTHYMDEAEQLCDRLVVIDGGRIVAEGSPADLIARYSTREVLELRLPTAERERAVAAVSDVGKRIEILPDRLLVYTDSGESALEQVRAHGVQLFSSLVRRSTLEDVFLRLTGRSLTDGPGRSSRGTPGSRFAGGSGCWVGGGALGCGSNGSGRGTADTGRPICTLQDCNHCCSCWPWDSVSGRKWTQVSWGPTPTSSTSRPRCWWPARCSSRSASPPTPCCPVSGGTRRISRSPRRPSPLGRC